MTTHRVANKFPFHWFWYGLSIIGAVAGISGLIDGLVIWIGVFSNFLELYNTVIREPLKWVVGLLWPSSWSSIPAWFYDFFVAWSSLNIALQYWHIRTHKQSMYKLLFSEFIDNLKKSKGSEYVMIITISPLLILVNILTVTIAPFVYPVFSAYDYIKTKSSYSKNLLFFYGNVLVSVIGIVLVLVNINYQMKSN